MGRPTERRARGGGRHAVFKASRPVGAPPDRRFAVTLVCRRNPAHAHGDVLRELERRPPHARPTWSDGDFDRVFGAATAELDRIVSFARAHGFEVEQADRRTRLVSLSGDRESIERAFGVRLALFDLGGEVRRGHAQPVRLPPELEGIVEAVLGLDDLPAVRRPLAAGAGRGARRGHSPLEIARRYRFPSSGGEGEVVGVLEMDGGFEPADLAAYSRAIGVRRPKVTVEGPNRPADPELMKRFVRWMNGASRRPAGDLAQAYWTFETTMDVELVAALANRASIRVRFASENDGNGAVRALRELLHSSPRPTVLSLSWALGSLHEVQGGDGSAPHATAPDKGLYQLFEDAFHEAMVLGVSVCCASGDSGSKGLQVDYPAASRYVLACGGTSLRGERGKGAREIVWNARKAGIRCASGGGLALATGGGPPSWQLAALTAWAAKDGRSGEVERIARGVPDVAALADFQTGCQLLVAGMPTTAGGTSASAPLWAALLARVNAHLHARTGKRLGYANPALYDLAVSQTFTSVGEGSNCLGRTRGPYRAVPGTWDPCTGLGTPDGERMLAALASRR